MKKIDVIYNSDGYIESVTDNSMHFEQENDCLVINATIETDKKVRAYLRASNGNSLVTDEIEPEGNVYSLTVSQEYMAKGSLYAGFELYDGTGYIERLEPLKVYIDSFVSLGGGSSDNVYVVTIKVGNVETLENGEPATVENVGTKKDMILNFGLPRGEQGIKGDKGDKGDTGPQGERGIQGVQGIQGVAGKDGKDGYTPIKGVDYFTPEDIESLGINDKAGIDYVDESVAGAYLDLDNKKADQSFVENLSADLSDQIDQKVDKVDGKELSTNDFTDDEKNKLNGVDNNATSSPIVIELEFEEDGEGEDWASWQNKTFFNQYRRGLYYIEGWYGLSDGGDYYESVILLCTSNEDGGEHIKRLLITHSGDVYTNRTKPYNPETGEAEEYNYEWEKISVSQTDLNKAIGDVETALDTIISMQNSLIGGDGE